MTFSNNVFLHVEDIKVILEVDSFALWESPCAFAIADVFLDTEGIEGWMSLNDSQMWLKPDGSMFVNIANNYTTVWFSYVTCRQRYRNFITQ